MILNKPVSWTDVSVTATVARVNWAWHTTRPGAMEDVEIAREALAACPVDLDDDDTLRLEVFIDAVFVTDYRVGDLRSGAAR